VIAIIGAGAAGLLAAVAAVNQGKPVTIYEKMNRPGIKLSMTGGGRCNLTNTGDLFTGLHGTRFLYPALAKLDSPVLRQVLRGMGVDTIVDDLGRVYPKGMKGKEFTQHLHTWLVKQGVRFHFSSTLTGLVVQDDVLRAIEIEGKTQDCARAILACGGNTYPKTGSDGGVAEILMAAGHTISPLLPALAPLKTREAWPTQLKGISLQNINVTITAQGKNMDSAQGDLLFTHFGLSGPAVLDVSHAAARALRQGKDVHLVIDLLPHLTCGQILELLEQQRQKTLANALTSLFPAQVAKTLGKDGYIKGLAPSTLRKFAQSLKETRLEVIDVLGKNHAMVAQGGANLREINPRTMESKKIRGLHIVGELLNYHGRTGGYNLHAAFATGWLAGENV